MSSVPGTKVVAKVVPLDTADTYATHDDKYGAGGLQTDVADATARLAITTPRRKKGMIVYQTDNQHYYKLNNDLTTWTDFGITLGGGGNADLVQANGITDTLTGLTASTSNDNIVASLPGAHGIEVGDIIEFQQSFNANFINYRTYARNVIEIQNTLPAQIEITDVVPWAANATYDIEVAVDGGSNTAVSFTINSGDTWADVITAVNSGLSTAGLAATAYFNSTGNLWAGGASQADKGVLIRSNTLGTGSQISVSAGTVNDFLAALSAESYSYNIDGSDSSGSNLDIVVAVGFTFAAGTYNISGPIYNGTFTVLFQVAPGTAIINTLTPNLFSNGYTTQNPGDLSNQTATHILPGNAVSGTVTISNANDVTYSGTPVTIASIATIDVIRKHYINNGNVGIGTQNPAYPLDVQKDLYYKNNKVPKNNHKAIAAPTSTDDASLDYENGSTWIYNDVFYVCTSATIGAAVWTAIGAVNIVTEVNGQNGPTVLLTTTDVAEGTNLYYTDGQVETAIGNLSKYPRWVKFTKSYTDLNTTNNTMLEILLELYGPPKRYIQSVVLHHTDSFLGGSIATATARLMWNSVLQGGSAFDVFQAPDNTPAKRSSYQINDTNNFDTTNALSVLFTVDTNLNQLTQGTLDIWVLMSILP